MRSCLMVDDSSVIRKVGARLLGDFGLEVLPAAGGTEALAAFRAAPADLVIVSSPLPDMACEELVRALRGEPGGANALVLAMLADNNLGQMTRLKRAGADGFVGKPFDRQTLTRALAGRLEAALAA